RFQTRNPLGLWMRSRSPSGGSTLTTRAPASASTTPAMDAATLPEPSSSTFRPAHIDSIQASSIDPYPHAGGRDQAVAASGVAQFDTTADGVTFGRGEH